MNCCRSSITNPSKVNRCLPSFDCHHDLLVGIPNDKSLGLDSCTNVLCFCLIVFSLYHCLFEQRMPKAIDVSRSLLKIMSRVKPKKPSNDREVKIPADLSFSLVFFRIFLIRTRRWTNTIMTIIFSPRLRHRHRRHHHVRSNRSRRSLLGDCLASLEPRKMFIKKPGVKRPSFSFDDELPARSFDDRDPWTSDQPSRHHESRRPYNPLAKPDIQVR
jgi:hypothetical protein